MDRIALFIDYIENLGGVEREIVALGKYFDMDVYAGIYNRKTTFPELEEYNIISFRDGRLQHGLNQLYLRRKFSNLKLNGYDVYIMFGGASLHIAKNHHPNIWYCNSPTRWLYDLYGIELQKRSFMKRQLFRFPCFLYRYIDKKNVLHIDKILANSINVQNRIKKFYNLESEVVYPPVDIKKFRFKKFGDFYLSATRLEPLRRIHLTVRAFQRMKSRKLVISGDGIEYEKIKRMSSGFDNIKVLGRVSDEKQAELYGNCLATIYIPYDEDFGLIPIESMSSGKPCIGANDGGVKETIIHKKTGLLIEPTVENIIKAVEWLTPERAKKMRKACEERAKKFSEDKFIRGIKKAIDEVAK